MAKKKVLLLFSCEVISDSFVTPWPVACQAALSGISQARILEWVAISFSKGLPNPEIKPVSPALAGGFFTAELPRKPDLLGSNTETFNLEVKIY